MILLVSVIHEDEVDHAISGRADIIDIKNPREGSLGAATPDTISRIIKRVDGRRETSVALGDLPNLPGTVSLAAAGAATLKPDYIKLGLLGTRTPEEARSLLEPAIRTVKQLNPNTNVIACGYADSDLVGSVSPLVLPEIVQDTGGDGVLVDTIHKDGRSLFDFISDHHLNSMVNDLRERGLISALAGSLTSNHATRLKDISPDVIGIRGAACVNNDRANGRISAPAILSFKSSLT